MMIRVAAAYMQNNNGEVLLAARSKGRFAGKWEFPGGKIEEGETAEDAVAREIREELGVDIIPGKILGVFRSSEEEKQIELSLLSCEFPKNETIHSDGSHLSFEWVHPDRFGAYDLIPFDADIAAHLRKTVSK